jgi:hypothetical protein
MSTVVVSPLSKNFEEIVKKYDTCPYVGPSPPSLDPEPVGNMNGSLDLEVFKDAPLLDWVVNWTREDLEMVLPHLRQLDVKS